MCGYIFLKSNIKKDHNSIKKSIPKIENRGPDQTNIIHLQNKTLIHTRLSIVDINNGSQPMQASKDDINYWILFNGEIYNHIELKNKLKRKYKFKTNSDTEVLLASYIVWGEKCLEKIIGMYSFVIVSNDEEIFCARDLTGQKPLFYSLNEDKIVISSIPIRFDQQKDISEESIADFLINGYLTSNRTILKGVFNLEPGFSLKIKNNKIKKFQFWKLEDYVKNKNNNSQDEILRKIDHLLNKIVKNYKNQADVPIALLLSGGIDSSLLLRYFQKNKILPDCYTLDTEDSKSELEESKKYINPSKHKIIKSKKINAEFFEYVYGNIFSQPFSDSSALYTSKLIKELSKKYKCAIGGDGADEIFAGYHDRIIHLGGNMIFNISFYRRIISQIISRIKNKHLIKKIFFSGYRYPIFNLNIINDLLSTNFKSKDLFSYESENFKFNSKEKILIEDFLTYLPNNINIKLDEISMHYGVELRSPFQDRRIIEYALSIPAKNKFNKKLSKILLRKIHSNYLEDNSYNSKKGFGLNYEKFLKRKDMQNLYKKYIEKNSKISKFINNKNIDKILNKNYSAKRWNYLCLAIWIEKNT